MAEQEKSNDKVEPKKIRDKFDLFNPLISEVVAGVEGKMILVYSDENKVGKTKVGTELPKPYYLRFESGLSGISGIPYAPLTSWIDFKQLNRKLTDPRQVDKVRELYQTIIIDTFDVAIQWCDAYICNLYGVKRLNDAFEGFGAWAEYKKEWFNEWNKLMNAGYTIYGISHADSVKKKDPVTNLEYTQLQPYGDKRTIKLIKDTADFCGYVQSNGIDEDGNEIPSSIYFVETPHFVAGSRFDMPSKIEVFSAENLQKAIKEAVEKDQSTSKTDYQTNKQKEAVKVSYTYEEIMARLSHLWDVLGEKYGNKLIEIVDEYLGPNKRVSDATPDQMQQLEMILFELEELENGE